MWELSINLSDNNAKIAKRIYIELKEFCKCYGGIVTTHERLGTISILISCNVCDGNRVKYFIENLIAEVIVEEYKLEYLNQSLALPNLDPISKTAFIQALLSFDKESDKYMVQKLLTLNGSIDIDAFFYFKLGSLREKWKELVQIANDNKGYLSSNETLVELLKFLVENLEIKNGEISILEENGSINFYDENQKLIKKNNSEEKDIDSTIISSLISLAPKVVNIYSNNNFNENLIKLLKQIFDKRINILTLDR
jgi:hypothetical protein